MKVLLIGGTGNISSAVTNMLIQQGNEVWLLNRGNKHHETPEGVNQLVADINNEAEVDRLVRPPARHLVESKDFHLFLCRFRNNA